ncbi:MAG: hypothetical protein ABIQ32_13855 [Sphingomicrobium sp.]
MKFAVTSVLFVVGSAFVAVAPAFAAAAIPTPVPLAGAGLLGVGAIAYLGRILRRMR